MDKPLVAQKIESLRRCIQRVSDKTPGDVDQLVEDQDVQDILVLNLTRAVQLCVDIGSHLVSESEEAAPANMGEVFSALHRLGAISAGTEETMRKAVGFRNVAVHNYDDINWAIVFAICRKSLPDFTRFVAEVVDYCEGL